MNAAWDLSLTDALAADAFIGDGPVTGKVARDDYERWAMSPVQFPTPPLIPSPAAPGDWKDPRIGWGIVLPEHGSDEAKLAAADDAPEPIRALVNERNGKVLRYRPDSRYSNLTLRDYAGRKEMVTAQSPPGMEPGHLPMYLLLCGPPTEIPWQLQRKLNPVRRVGRLDLSGEALDNYVQALLSDWTDSRARYDAPVVWSVDFSRGDITTLMRRSIAEPVYAKFSADHHMGSARFIDGSKAPATGAALAAALNSNTPALIVTSSHGMTSPLDDLTEMRASLGLPVDANRAPVRPDELLKQWQPDGAIWFAQACCSAGAASPSAYQGLFAPDSIIGQTLETVAALGAMTSPLPQQLLGAQKPLRAFVGRVEPTFNWTLSFPPNRQKLTSGLLGALYDRLCLGLPVGLAFNDYYQPISSWSLEYNDAVAKYSVADGQAETAALNRATYAKANMIDLANTVILGDPTVAIPLPPNR